MAGKLMGRSAVLAALMVAMFTAACEDAGPEGPRAVEGNVVSPHGAEGAVLIALVGPVDSVTMSAPGWLLADRIADTTWAFIGLATPGDLRFTIHLGAGRLVSSTLLEISGPDDVPREDLPRYRLRTR